MLHTAINKLVSKSVQYIHKYQNFLSFLLYNWGITFIIIIFCQPIYETDDDFAMGLIQTGVYGEEYKQYLIFSNIIYGYFLKLLSYCVPSINWYIVLQYLLISFSYSILFYLLSKKTNFSIAFLSNMSLWCFIIYAEIRYIQFTRTAFITCITGLILLIYGVINCSKKATYTGFILCLLGSFIRFECFEICIAYAIAFFVSYALHTLKNINTIKRLAKSLSIVTFVIIFFSLINTVYYSMDQEWKEYNEYNVVRGEILDFGIPSWENNQENYASIGFSQNDVTVLSHWIFNDSKKFNFENMNEIASWKTPKKIDLKFLTNTLKDLCQDFQSSTFFVIWLLSLVILFSIRTRGSLLLSLFNFTGTIIIFLFFHYIGRILPRVEFGIWMSAISINFLGCFEFNHMESTKAKSAQNNNQFFLKIGITFATTLFLIVKIGAFETYSVYENSTRDTLSYLSENSSNLYVLDTESFNGACFSFRPYKKVDSFYMSNYCWAGGWSTFSPYWTNYNRSIGFDNPLEDLSSKNNVYYVTNKDISYLLTYLQENYNVSSVELVETYNSYNIYKFYI